MTTQRQRDEVRAALADLPLMADAALPAGFVIALVAEVDRLRVVIKDAERQGECNGWICCPWCSAINEPRSQRVEPHEPDCAAFTPAGEVK